MLKTTLLAACLVAAASAGQAQGYYGSWTPDLDGGYTYQGNQGTYGIAMPDGMGGYSYSSEPQCITPRGLLLKT